MLPDGNNRICIPIKPRVKLFVDSAQPHYIVKREDLATFNMRENQSRSMQLIASI